MEQVIISPYSAEWIEDFHQEKEQLQRGFGRLDATIEHIGSTSIPGLGSKPTIDMMAGVEDLVLVDQELIERLDEIGYEYVHKPEFPERLFFRKGKWRAGTHHLHVYKLKGKHWVNNLLFREYLKAHEEARQEYYMLKKKLEAEHKYDRVAYTEGKSHFILDVMELARNDKELVAGLQNKGLR